MRGDYEAIANFIRNEIEKSIAKYKFQRYGIVDQWDKDNHTAKVKLQPGDYLTGWLPVPSGIGAGKGRGFAHGLTPGDQVLVGFNEGNLNTPVILQRFWSDKDKPIKNVESGEDHMVGLHKQWLKMLDKDKSLVLRGYPGHDNEDDNEQNDQSAKVTFDKDGNLIRSIKKGSLKAKVDKGSIEWEHPQGDAHFKPGSGKRVKVGQGIHLRVMLEGGKLSNVLVATEN